MRRRSALLSSLFVVAAVTLSGCSLFGGDEKAAPKVADSGEFGGKVVVLVDGWSVKSLGGTTIALGKVGVAGSSVTLEPLDEAAVSDMLKVSPAAVQAIAARLASPSPELKCGKAGCAVGEQKFSAAQIADPTTLPGELGELYSSWGVSDGVWQASIDAADVAGVTVAVDKATWNAPVLASDGSGSKPAAVFAVGVAFGRPFSITPAWLTDAGQPPADVVISEVTSPPLTPANTLAGGLGQLVPAAAGLSDIELTAVSSPSTGCVAGVLCAPGDFSASVPKEGPAAAEGRVCGVLPTAAQSFPGMPRPEYPVAFRNPSLVAKTDKAAAGDPAAPSAEVWSGNQLIDVVAAADVPALIAASNGTYTAC